MRWSYDNPDLTGNKKAIDWYISHRLKVMAATAAQTRWAMLPRKNSNFKSIQEFTRIASEKKMEGILCTIWEDSSPHFETMWRGIYHSASLSWNHENIGVAEAGAAFRHRFYAPALSGPDDEFQDLMEQALSFWDKALTNKGNRNSYPTKMDLIDLPDHAKPGEWTKKYSQKISGAKEEIARYAVIKSRITKAQQLARRNEYSLALMKQMNELQVYPSRLIILLAEYDKETSPEGRQKAQKMVQEHVAGFEKIRKNYDEVFFKTRLPNPPDYQLDSNGHHHLAAGSVNSDWMHVMELGINAKVNGWAMKNL
jgi:hypothetical protein